MPAKNTLYSNRGFAQVILLLFLLAGVGIGTLIVQNRTNFLPRADCNPGIDNDCDTGGGSEEGDPQGQEDAEKKEEQQDLEKGAREAGKSVDEYKKDDCKANPGKSECADILKKDGDKKDGDKEGDDHDSTNPNDECRDSPDRDKCEKDKKSDAGCGDEKTYCDGGTKIYKHGGYWDSDKGKCVYDFVDTHESCAGQKDGSLSNQDNEKFSELYDRSIQCEDITYCDDGKAYHQTPKGADDGKCQYDIKPDNSKDCTGKKDGDVVSTGKSKRLSTDPKNSLTPDDIQVKTDKFKAEGKSELDKAREHYRDTHGFNYDATKDEDTNISACRGKMLDGNNNAPIKDPEKCPAIVRNLKNISQAQDEFDKMAKISDCSGLSEDACKALKQAAFDNARLRYLTAMCDAVESDVQKANCVLDVGDSQNLLKVKVCTDGGTTCEEADKRVLIGCSSDTSRQNNDFECEKILNYRATDGSIKELPLSAKKQLQEAYCKSEADKQTQFCKDPEKSIYSLSDLPSGLRGGLNASCNLRGLSCIAAGQAASSTPITPSSSSATGASLPAGHLLTSDNGKKIPDWKPPSSFSNECKPSSNTPDAVGKAIACEYKKSGGGNVRQLAGGVSDSSLVPKKIEGQAAAWQQDMEQEAIMLAVMAAVKELGGSTNDIIYSGYNSGISKRCAGIDNKGCNDLIWQWAERNAGRLAVNSSNTTNPANVDCRSKGCSANSKCTQLPEGWKCAAPTYSPPPIISPSSTSTASDIDSVAKVLNPTTTDKCTTDKNIEYCTTSATTNFQDANNRTLVTVTVTKGTKNNIGEGQTVIAYKGKEYTIDERTTPVKTKSDLKKAIEDYNSKNKNNPIPIK